VDFTAANLTVRHTEILEKEMEFESWARRMVKDEDIVEQLRQMLAKGPAEAQTFLKPAVIEDKLTFHLQEGIIIGRTG
jgi:hypothetical protein